MIRRTCLGQKIRLMPKQALCWVNFSAFLSHSLITFSKKTRCGRQTSSLVKLSRRSEFSVSCACVDWRVSLCWLTCFIGETVGCADVLICWNFVQFEFFKQHTWALVVLTSTSQCEGDRHKSLDRCDPSQLCNGEQRHSTEHTAFPWREFGFRTCVVHFCDRACVCIYLRRGEATVRECQNNFQVFGPEIFPPLKSHFGLRKSKNKGHYDTSFLFFEVFCAEIAASLPRLSKSENRSADAWKVRHEAKFRGKIWELEDYFQKRQTK